MAYPILYSPQANSPETTIVFDISTTQTSFIVQDASVLPVPPTYLVIGGQTQSPETVLLTQINDNTITVERAFEGQAQMWQTGTTIARNFTAKDHAALIEWVKTLKADTPGNSNRNLLDNPFFTINQRNLTNYTGTGSFYTADRWKISNHEDQVITATLSTAGITLLNPNGYVDIRQYFSAEMLSFFRGKTVTASVHISFSDMEGSMYFYDGEHRVSYGAAMIPSAKGIYNTQIYIPESSSDDLFFVLSWPSTSGVTLKSVKLELGQMSTLAFDAPPDPALELLKCQRYLLPITGGRYSGAARQSEAWIFIPTPVTMRMNPTVIRRGTGETLLTDEATVAVAEYPYGGIAHKNGVDLSGITLCEYATTHPTPKNAILNDPNFLLSAEL